MGNAEGTLPEALESIEKETEMTRDELQRYYLKFNKKVLPLGLFSSSVPTRSYNKEGVYALNPSPCWH
jgi:hypothetical protein